MSSHIAIVTLDGFNELDSLIALGVLNRVKRPGWRVSIASPTESVRSMNGIVLKSHISLTEAADADAVIIGSGMRTRELVADANLMAQMRFDPSRQLLAAQCSGTLILAKLGLLDGVPACTDLTTKPWVEEAGIDVLNQPFFGKHNVATAGGCLASHYLAAWIIARLVDSAEAASAIRYVAPVGEKEEYVARALRNIQPYLPDACVGR
jgi:transcriptional regulator GlxA family with amidase domain